MKAATYQQRNGTGFTDSKTHLAATRGPLFPFSSPNFEDDRSSSTSDHSRKTLQVYQATRPKMTNVTSGPMISQNDERAGQKGQAVSITKNKEKDVSGKTRPELQIITSLSQSPFRRVDVVLNEVAVKRPAERKNLARSIISQKGVKVVPSSQNPKEPTRAVSQSQNSARGQFEGSRPDARPQREQNVIPKQTVHLQSTRAVVFGLQVPQHEASKYQQNDSQYSAVTLVTPQTPRIVVTPADNGKDGEPSEWLSAYEEDLLSESTNSSTPKSAHEIQQKITETEAMQAIQKSRRFSSESQEQIIPESCETPRHKSQGWWNLMLSPMLSRAGTLRNPKAIDDNEVPPVPPLPTHLAYKGKTDPEMQRPLSFMSPVTPRRLGLASVGSSPRSSVTEWEDDDSGSEAEEKDPTLPRDYTNHDSNAPALWTITNHAKAEGLAAEYYHACAVEQLTNVTYFECVNHCCAERLPKLQSIFDTDDTSSKSRNTRDENVRNPARGLLISHNQDDPLSESSTIVADQADDKSRVTPISQLSAVHKRGLRSSRDSEPDLDEIVSPNIREANTATFSKARTVDSREPSPAPVLSKTKAAVKQRSMDTITPSVSQESAASTLLAVPKSVTGQHRQNRSVSSSDQQSTPASKGMDKSLTVDSNIPKTRQPPVESPGPISPEATRAAVASGAIPMAPLQSLPAQSTVPLMAPVPQATHALANPFHSQPTAVYYPYGQSSTYPIFMPPHQHNLQEQLALHQVGVQSEHERSRINPLLAPHVTMSTRTSTHTNHEQKADENQPHASEMPKKEEKQTNKFGLLCGCFGRAKSDGRKKPCRTIGIVIALIVIVVASILFAILFRRRSLDANPVESQWLNLTGYPPVPTGISTIAQPNLVDSEDRCVRPNAMWSCALPKESQDAILPNKPDQPNFRFQIRFRNGTVPANLTIPLGKRASGAGADDLFVPNPNPPSQQDQFFLGDTTDNVTRPFDGEETPFFITFMSAEPGEPIADANSRKLKIRQSDKNGLSNSIPPPSIAPDGTAAPASLLPTTPFPLSQPVKLYNRGLRDEHYGFYIYYDKSIFLSAISLSNTTASNGTLAAATNDEDGGSTKLSAKVRCTWSQTRFVVKMYTSPAFQGKLLSGPTTNATNSSANNFNRPGSFFYPTTISLDRHGGDINKKLIYCYGMDRQNINNNEKVLVPEVRAFGGVPVNAAPNFIDQGDSNFNTSRGGIDGGSGGCGCTWQNWT